MADNKNKLFSFFSNSGDNKGVDKEKEKFNGKYNLENYFKFLKRNFANLTKVNILFVLLCFPLFIYFIGLAGFFNGTANAPQNLLYPQVYGAMQYDGTSAAIISYVTAFGNNTSIAEITPTTKALMYCGFLILLTYGFANTGITHIVRSMVRRQPIFLWSDFFECIKKNWKQSIKMGILDAGLTYLLVYDLIQYGADRETFMIQIFYVIILMAAIIFYMMRFYIYLILITFDLPIKKILANSLRFVMLGIKRNIIGGVVIALIAYLSVNIYILMPQVGIMLPLIFTIALGTFTAAYCAYPIISKYMIEPFYTIETNDDGAPIFIDRG